jgi:hypothetical protein
VRRAGERGAKRARSTGTPRMGWRRAPPRAPRANHHARRRARRVVAHGGDGSGSRSHGEKKKNSEKGNGPFRLNRWSEEEGG